MPTTFQFTNDPNNIFGLSAVRGTVKPKSNARIIVYFRPRHTICYYERVRRRIPAFVRHFSGRKLIFFLLNQMFCIVRNHSLFPVDLLGTCYDLLIKPLPLLQKHIDAFRRRVIWGKLSEIDFKYMENAFLLKYSNNNNNQNKDLDKLS